MSALSCLPLQYPSFDEALSVVKKFSDNYDCFELWLDDYTEIDISVLTEALSAFSNQFIFLFRRPLLAPITTPLSVRKQCIDHLATTPYLYDCDITIQQEELQYSKDHAPTLNTIVSYHNYESTPEWKELLSIKEQMREFKPYIFKLACYCQKKEETLRLLQLLLHLKENDKNRAIVLGMGDDCIITRIFGGLWGNEIDFVLPEIDPHTGKKSEGSAPGQMTLSQLQTIRDLLLKS